MQTTNNNPRGIVLIIIAMSLFAMQDALIKFIFERSALYEIFFGRYVVAAFLLFCFLSFLSRLEKKKKVNNFYRVESSNRLRLYQNLHGKLGQQTPSAGTLLGYLDITA